MVNTSTTPGTDFRDQLVQALREAQDAVQRPKSEAEMAKAALNKLHYDYPEASHEELNCLLQQFLGPAPPTITTRLLDVIAEEAGRIEIPGTAAEPGPPPSQQALYAQIQAAALLATLQRSLQGAALPELELPGTDGVAAGTAALAEAARSAAVQLDRSAWVDMRLAPRLQSALKAARTADNLPLQDFLATMGSLVLALQRFCEISAVDAPACATAALPCLLDPSGLDSESTAHLAGLGVRLASAAMGAQHRGHSALWHAVHASLGPALERCLLGQAGDSRDQATACLAWLALHAPPSSQGTQLLTSFLVPTGIMRALVPRCLATPSDPDCWTALLLVCTASPTLLEWAVAVPGFERALEYATLPVHRALFLYVRAGHEAALRLVLEGHVQAGVCEALPVLQIMAAVHGIRCARALAEWGEEVGVALAALQAQVLSDRRAAAARAPEPLPSGAKPAGAEERTARLVTQREAAAHAACLDLLKDLMAPPSTGSKKD